MAGRLAVFRDWLRVLSNPAGVVISEGYPLPSPVCEVLFVKSCKETAACLP